LEDTKNATQTWFTDRYNDAVNFALGVKKDVTDFINQDWQMILENMALNTGLFIYDRIQDFTNFKDSAVQSFNDLAVFVFITMTETIPNFIASVPGVVEGKFNEAKDFGIAKMIELNDFIATIPGWVDGKFNEAKDSANNKLLELKNYGIARLQELMNFFTGVPSTADREFNNSKNNANNKLEEMKNYAKDRVKDIQNYIEGLPKVFEDSFNTAKTTVTSKIDDMRNAISSFANDAKNSVGGIFDKFAKGLSGEGRANGGSVLAGTRYTVAEEGRELYRSNQGDWQMLAGGPQPFTPQKDGFIFPNLITEQILNRIQPNQQNTRNSYNFTNKFDLPETSEGLQGYYSANKLLSSMDKELRGQLA
jgi:hypothetical protein